MSVPDAERVARAGLSRVAEPVDVELLDYVASCGPVAAWRSLHGGAAPVSDRLRRRLAPRLAVADPAADLAAVRRLGGRLVCPGDDEWPAGMETLGRVGAPAFGLWVRGRPSLDEACRRAVAVVGSRAASDYGSYVAGELAAGLADRGWTVLSGAAYGIDAAAHRGALAAGGQKVGVLACGVDVVYPSGHAGLLHRVAAEGLLVSELPPGCAPHRVRFLVRNRLIAALAGGTVVVEAATRSGALNTARHTLDLGRPLMAVPGPVTSAGSTGCHRLLREQQAVLVTCPGDVLEVVGRYGEYLTDAAAPTPELAGRLPGELRRVLDAVPVARPAPAERIARVAGADPVSVVRALALLQARGLVRRAADGWRLTPRSTAG